MPRHRVTKKQASKGNEHGGSKDHDIDDADHDGADAGHPQRLAKNLVRFALSQELQRSVMKPEMLSKVTKGRPFNEVFALAQNDFRDVFGMELAELPMRDSTGRASPGAAQADEHPDKPSKSYILTSILDPRYRDDDIVECHGFKQQTYDGFVGFVVAVIYLNGGSLPAPQLLRYLGSLNADEWMPLDRTENVLQLMIKQGYIIRTEISDSEETSYVYHLGPRGEVEIGQEGVLHMIKTVYGDVRIEDLEAKFKRSIGAETIAATDEPNPMATDGDRDNARHRRKDEKKPAAGRGQMRGATSDEDGEDEAVARSRAKGKQKARAAPDTDDQEEEDDL